MTATVRISSILANLMVSSSICWASSRVGAMMMAYGPWSASSCLTILGREVIQTSRGSRKASVLPLPVSATPMMSRFWSPIGMACRWMGVGSL
uniref:Putative secreted protein n=1 Tax=Ixodes ricinus TaxID=34613 RepID=A0A147BU69_IXORI